jgi:uncharacterized membrane protein
MDRLFPATGRDGWGLPRDLALDGGLVVGGVVLALVGLVFPAGSVPRGVLVLPLAIFLPGYALTTVLFPATGDGGRHGRAGVPAGERLALSVGFSVALVPLLVVVLWFLARTVALVPVLLALAVFVTATTAAGLLRRRRMAAADRYTPPVGPARVRALLSGSWGRDSAGRATQAALVGALLVLGVSFATAAIGPLDGPGYTSFALLTEDESGDLVAADYPETLRADDSRTLTVAVENRERDERRYSIVVALQRVENGTVRESTRLERFGERVAPGERWTVPHDPARLVSPGAAPAETRLRLTYLLYRGAPPTEPDRDTAYRWLDIGVELGETLGR